MQVFHWNRPQDQNWGAGESPSSEGAELSLRAEEAGEAGRRALLIRAEGEAGRRPEPEPEPGDGDPEGPEGPTLGGPGGEPPWAPDWDALLERTVFRLEADDPFQVGRPNWNEIRRTMSELRARDLVLLGMLYQHRYLSSRALGGLFWPSNTHRGAMKRLNELHADYRLLTRWQQLAPRRRGAASRRPYVYMLTARGAALLAEAWGLDIKATIRRAWHAAHHPKRVHHDLAVSEFFTGLAVAAASWAGCGLYHWVGDDAMKRNHELVKGSLAPDSWGRLLLPNREIKLNLEWDAGTEGGLPLTSKLRLYAVQLPPGEQVLFVAPHTPREKAIRQAVRYVLGGDVAGFPLLTSSVGTLKREGQLGPAWTPIEDDSARLGLFELAGQPRTELEVGWALAKPYWWERRPGGGEGA